MLEQMGAADTAELDLKLRLVSEAGERLIAYAYEQPTPEARTRILAEMKKMLAGYLFPQSVTPNLAITLDEWDRRTGDQK